MTALVDLIPTNPSPFLTNSPHTQTKRVYGRIIYTNRTATKVPPSVELVGFPAYNAQDETHIYSRAYDAVLLEPSGVGPNAGIWYTDVPIYDDPDLNPTPVFVVISHPDWQTIETRRVLSNYADKVAWMDCALVVPIPEIDYTPRQWIGSGSVVILGAHENPPAVPVSGVLYARLAEGAE